MVKNLSQLKKSLANGQTFLIAEHYIKPQMKGQKRYAAVMQTNGMYSKVLHPANDEENDINTWNGGKGSWIEFGKASEWEFSDGFCTQSSRGRKIWTICVLDEIKL